MAGIDLTNITAYVESLMVDECAIYPAKNAMEGAWNEDSGQYDPPTAVAKYEGKCQVWSGKQGARAEPAGGQDAKGMVYFVEIPKSAAYIELEDVIVITSVSDQGNSEMVNLELMVESVDLFSYSPSKIIKGIQKEVAP